MKLPDACAIISAVISGGLHLAVALYKRVEEITVRVYIDIALIILSIALTVAILLQTRSGGLGSMFGGEGMSGGMYKTRRGLEKTLFQITIGLSVAFFILVVVGVAVSG